LNTAAQVVGVADAVTRGTTNVAAGLVGLVADPDKTAERLGLPGAAGRPGTTVTPARARGATSAATGSHAEAGQHRSPYRLDGDVLYLLDQRGLPDRLDEVVCRRASDVAFYMRVMAVRGGPLLGQLAAYGLALTAREFATRTHPARTAEWKRVCRSLVAARPSARMVRFVTERMTAVYEGFGVDADGTVIADGLRAQADALAMESQLDHAVIARTLAQLLPRPEGRSLQVLVHGVPGTSTGGYIGTALNGLALIAQEGRPVKAYLAETRPYLEGSRLAAWELAPTDVSVTVLADTGVAHVLDREPIDAVLLGAEWIAANGDTANVAGSRAVAELAAVARRGPVPVYVSAPATSIDPATADGDAIPVELRPGRELGHHLDGLRMERTSTLLPACDVVPAGRIGRFVTEVGVLAPDAHALAGAFGERQARRPPIPVPPSVAAAS
jgi:methylthioribose-1-phosphate isomerase